MVKSKPRKKTPILLTDDLALEGDQGRRSRSTRLCAERLAQRLGTVIHLVHVEDLYLYPVKTPANQPIIERWFLAKKTALAQASESASVPIRGLFVHGDPVKKIVSLVSKRGAYEMIVVGTHGRKGPGRLLLGSVAEEIIRNSSVPVLTVGPKAQEHAHEFLREEKATILFATELGPNSERAQAYVQSLAKQLGASVIVFHGLHDALHPVLQAAFANPNLDPSVQSFLAQEKARALKGLQAQVRKFAKAGVTATPILAETTVSASEAILAHAGPASLIVMGTHGRSHLAGAFFGRTARDVILGASRPVITVRSKRS